MADQTPNDASNGSTVATATQTAVSPQATTASTSHEHPAVIHAAPPVHHGSRRRIVILATAVIVLAAAAYFGGPTIVRSLNTVSTDDAYVNGHVTFVAPRVRAKWRKFLWTTMSG